MQQSVRVGGTSAHIIHLTGIYPIHQIEQQYITDHGLNAFWNLDWDPYDVTRPPAV